MGIYRQLFSTFFKIGLFTIGSGYAMIPLIQREVVEKRGWFTDDEFLDKFSLAQSSPGPFSLNTAVFVGYKMRGFRGALVSVAGIIIPPFVIMLAIATYLISFRDNHWVNAAFQGMRPAVLALITVPFIRYVLKFKWWGVILAFASAAAIFLLGVNPVYLILAAAAAGVFLQFFRK